MRFRSNYRDYVAAAVAFTLIAAACGSGGAGKETTATATSTTVVTRTAPPVAALPEAQLTVEESVVTVNGTEIRRADPTRIEIDDQIALGDGALAFLRLGDPIEFELIKGTKLQLESVESLSIEAFLEVGHLRVTVDDETDAQLKLTTPNAVLNTLRSGTQFTFCQSPTGGVCVSVSKGAVEVNKAGRTETFVAGESSFAGPDDPLGPPICVPDEAFDEWFEASRRNQDPRPLSKLVADSPLCDASTTLDDGSDTTVAPVDEVDGTDTTVAPVDEVEPAQPRALVRATVDAGTVALFDRTNPIIGTDEYVSELTPPEFAPLTQIDGQVRGFIDVNDTTNQQFYDYATFTTASEPDPVSVWARLTPASWQAASPGVPQSFDMLGLDPRAPVTGVSFLAADSYCVYALKRLPTEIEWELAARDGLIDVSTVQNWVSYPQDYAEVPDGEQVIRGSFGIEELPLYFRTIGDTPTNRLSAGIRCAADDVIEVEKPTGELSYLRQFSGEDEAHDWPDLHDPNRPEVAFGYHAPNVFHIEARDPLRVAVGSGTVLPPDSIVSAEVELRLPEQPAGGFWYGIIANADAAGSLSFMVQDTLSDSGQRTLLWCVRRSADQLLAPGVSSGIQPVSNSACDAEGAIDVVDVRNRLAIGFSEGEATFLIGSETVATIAEVFRADTSFGFVVENTEPSLLSHAHFDNLTVLSF